MFIHSDGGHGTWSQSHQQPTNILAIYDLVRGFSRKTVGHTALVMQSSIIVFWEYYTT